MIGNQNADVTVVGTGTMGSAIVRSLATAGYRVVAWNRSRSKLEPLRAMGVEPANTLAEAITASPVLLICIRNYTDTGILLRAPEIEPTLNGRLVVQLSTGSPLEARGLAEWVTDAGGRYLDGAMLVYPELIGKPDARFMVAGPKQHFDQFEPMLRCIAPDSEYAGPNVGAACAKESALMALVLGTFLGYIHGVRVCEAEGLDLAEYTERMASICVHLGQELRALNERITARRFDSTHAPLHTYQSAARILSEHAQAAHLDESFPRYAHELLTRALAAGLGEQDFASLIQLRGSTTS